MSTAQDKNSSISCEAQLEGLQLLTSAGIFSTDVNLTITNWNHWLEANSGKSSELVVGRNLLEVFPEIADRDLNSYYEQALRGQVIVLSQAFHKFLIRLPPSAESHLAAQMPQSVRIAPLLDNGVIVGTMTLIEDVSERIAREADLFVRARQQAAIAALSREALGSHDLEALLQKAVLLIGETLEVSHCAVFEITQQTIRLKAAVGWSVDPNAIVEPCGSRSHADLVMQNENPLMITDLATDERFEAPQLFREAGIVSGIVAPICSNGQTCALSGAYLTERWRQSTESLDFLQAAANTLGTAIERDTLEHNLRQRAQELTTADRRKNEFLAMLAHELRNPLAPIRNAVQLLHAKDHEDEDIRAAHDLVDRQIRQMTRLVDDLLDVSRITRGKIALQTDTVNLASVIRQAIENSRPQIEAHQHQLTIELPSQPMPVRADVTRLAQAITNLINNAAKYTDPGGKIMVGVQRDGSDYLIKVQDNGIGISSEMLPQIFDLFTQVDNSLDRSEGGLGIGLTVVRTLIEMHDGSVQAFSEGKGKGSQFVVRIPALAEHVELRRAASPEKLSKGGVPRRVLVVDDNRDAAETLTRLLKVLGHESRSVHSGTEALEAIAGNHPDLVFLDIGLPGMDGFEVARQLRKDYPTSKMTVIALSGYAESANESKDAGFDMHLTKPMDLDILRELLNKPLSR